MFAADRTTPVRRGDRLLQTVLDGTELPPTLAWVGPPGHQRAYVRSSSKIARPDGSALGTLVVALCGETFPVTRAAKPGSPVCPECKKIYESMPPGDDA